MSTDNLQSENHDLVAYIVHHLSEGDNPNDIVMAICQQADLAWPEAEALVRQVSNEQGHEITRRQLPLLVTIALALFVAGVVITIIATVTLSTVYDSFSKAHLGPVDIAGALFYLLECASWAFSFAVIGIGMILGSLIGMRQAWASILKI